MVLILVINTVISSMAIFAMRGVYFALLEECRVPLAVTGTAAGVVSLIGFTPDVFMPMVGGVLLDSFSAAKGYRLLFTFTVGLCILGLLAALIILRKFVKQKNLLFRERKDKINLNSRYQPSTTAGKHSRKES